MDVGVHCFVAVAAADWHVAFIKLFGHLFDEGRLETQSAEILSEVKLNSTVG